MVTLAEWEFVRTDLGGPWEALRPAEPGSPEAVPGWSPVTLPHCFNALDAVDPDGPYYQGPGWYRRTLEVRNPFAGGRTLLRFEGAGQKTQVYLGLVLVASHTGGYDEWTADLTAALADRQPAGGAVSLLIRCDNSRDLELLPSDLSDFTLYGGLYRPVSLVYRPGFSLGPMKVRPRRDPDGRWTVSVALGWEGEGQPGKVEFRVFGPQGNLVASDDVAPAGDGLLGWSFPVPDPRLWSPEQPSLYRCSATLRSAAGDSEQVCRFGLRWFEFEERGPFRLNGERLLLRGTHRHEDHAGVGAALTDAMMAAEIAQMKAMGVNFLRLGHYQQSCRFLDLCDEHGILVWEEIPWCRGGLGGRAYRDQARRMLTALVEQHGNHPSVIVWGLGNELDWPGDFPEFDREAIRAFLRELHDLCHRLDGTRPTALRRCEFCRDIVDVYSPSIWAGWYRGVYTDYRAVTEHEVARGGRFLHVEWGGDSHAGRHAEAPPPSLDSIAPGQGADERAGDASLTGGEARVSKDGDWSESYICDLFDWHLTEQESMPWLSGTAFWIFKDFATPLRPDNPVPYVNQKGVVARDGTPKESYYVFQSRWTTTPMVRLYGHSWPVRWGAAGEPKEVRVYSNALEAELFVNGVSQGSRRRDGADFPAAGLRWTVVFTPGDNHLRAEARSGPTLVTDELSFYYQTGAWGPPASLTLRMLPFDGDVVTVRVEVRDAEGRMCLDEAKMLRFSLAGDGQLLDNQGTPWGSRVVQLANGQGEIRVRRNGGVSQVAVRYPGLVTGFCQVE